MEPPGLHIGILNIRYYGIILMLGAILAALLCSWIAKRKNLDSEVIWDSLIWVLLGGIVGARLWHVFLPSTADMILDSATGKMVNPYFVGGTVRILDILSIWRGGLGIPGAIIGGGIALYIYSRVKHIDFLQWADIAAPGLALAQGIGRWGNYVNAELCGNPTNLPWGITRCINTGYPLGTKFHPIFLYESLWNLMNMGILLILGSKFSDRLKNGDLFLIYLIIYSIGRFLLEFLRMDVAQVSGVNANQTIMAIVALISSAILIIRHLKQ